MVAVEGVVGGEGAGVVETRGRRGLGGGVGAVMVVMEGEEGQGVEGLEVGG